MMEESADDRPITLDELGIRQVQATRSTVFGKVRTWENLRWKELVFLILSLLSLVGVFVLTSFKIHEYFTCKADHYNSSSDRCPNGYENDEVMKQSLRNDFTFAWLVLISAGFCIFYVMNGVLQERPYELAIFVLGSLIILLYCAINYGVSEFKTDIKLARLILVCVASPCILGVGGFLVWDYHTSGNLIFRTIGSSTDLQKACKTSMATVALFKLDFQLASSLVVLVLQDGAKLGTLETVVLSVGAPLTLIWFIAGLLAVRLENKPLTYVVYSICWTEPAYVMFRIVKAAQRAEATTALSLPWVTIVAGVIAVITRAGLIGFITRTLMNYGRGLKQAIYGSSGNS